MIMLPGVQYLTGEALDIAALSIIVTEAGGVFTDLNGAPLDLDTRSVLAANPALHETYLSRLRGWVT